MNKSIQSQLEQAIRNQEEQVALRDKEINALRAQNAALLAALKAGYDDLRTRLILHAQRSFGASYDNAVRHADTAVPILAQMKAAITATESEASNAHY